jgi:hypothetical protein
MPPFYPTNPDKNVALPCPFIDQTLDQFSHVKIVKEGPLLLACVHLPLGIEAHFLFGSYEP